MRVCVYIYIYMCVCIYIYIHTYTYYPLRPVFMLRVSCDVHTHTPAKKTSANCLLYPFLLRTRAANRLGRGHGYEWHSSIPDIRAR